MATLSTTLGVTELRAVHGDTVSFSLDNVVDANGAAVADLTGWTVFFTLKESRSQADADAALAKTSPAGITLSGGVATWEITAAECAALTPNRYYFWDAQVKDPAGRIATVLEGMLFLTSQTTIRTAA